MIFQDFEKNLRAQSLTVEDPERKEKPLFDIEQELTNDRYQSCLGNLLSWVELVRINSDSGEYVKQALRGAAYTKLLFPEFDPEQFPGLKIVAEKFNENILFDDPDGMEASLLYLFSARIIFPDLVLNVSAENHRKIEKYLEERKSWNRGDFILSTAYLYVAFPEKAKKFLDDAWKLFERKELPRMKTRNKIKEISTSWAVSILSCARIISPGKFRELNLFDSLEVIVEYCKEQIQLQGLTNEKMLIAGLKIILAEDVKVTAGGLEIIMRKPRSFKEKNPPKPEIRKF